MNIDALAANIKNLDPTCLPATSDAEQDYFRHYQINFEEYYPDVIHHFGSIPCDKFDIVAHYYENKKAIETCFIIHGYYDHSGLYRHLIDYCLKRNFSVVIYDLPGHGLSTGERASIADFSDYQTVLCNLLLFFKDQAPHPWHAVGQSTGGAILMDFLLSSSEDIFFKSVLLAPLVRPQKWILSKVVHSVARFFIKQIKRDFSINSHDQSFLYFLENNDPLQSKILPLQWVHALKKWNSYFLKLNAASAKPLIIQGREDGTVDWPYNIPIIEKKFPSSKTFYLNSGRHQLVNESEAIRQTIFSAMDIYFDVFTKP
jgi:lysophospholipase